MNGLRRARLHWLVAAALVCGAMRVEAQRICPPATGAPYLMCQVDVKAELSETNRPPSYPEMARANGQSADLRVQFVIDTTGRVDMSTFMAYGDSGRFRNAVRSTAPRFRYRPATRKGQPVKVLQEELFSFGVGPFAGFRPADGVSNRNTTAEGIPWTHIGAPEPNLAAAARISNSALLDAEVGAVRSLTRKRLVNASGADAPSAICVALRSRIAPIVPDVARLAAVSAAGVRARTIPECPRTYASMFQVVDSTGRPVVAPSGYVDPLHIVVTDVAAWNANYVFIRITIAHGSAEQLYVCGFERAVDSWAGDCTLTLSVQH